MPRTLFDISEDMIALDELLFESGGDVTDPDVAAAIDAWQAELDHDLEGKVNGYVSLIREIECRVVGRQAELDRLTARVRADTNAAKSLKDRLKFVLEERGILKLDVPRGKVAVTKNGGKVPLELNEALVPSSWMRQPPPVPDTELIRKCLATGDKLSFASLGERGTHLRIR